MMDIGIEFVCCQEIEKMIDKMSENDAEVSSITNLEGFEAVCQNRWVLQTYFVYREWCGSDDQPIHE